ncbi:putative reverse transcriptase domain-containing protein [Tanacetum coccineum]
MMPCPCTTCLNHIEHKVEEVQFHLFKYRIDLSYTKWDKHGEKDEQATTSKIPVNATTKFVDDTDFDMDFGLEIPTDGPAIVEMVNNTKESFDEDDLVKFQELLLDTEKPLYKGCPNFTKLSAIVKLLNLKGKYGAADKFFTELLRLLKKMLPIVFLDNQVDDMTSHHTKYTSPALTQNMFANIRRVGKEFSGNETPLFDTVLVPPQTQVDEDVEIPVDEEQPVTTSAPSTSKPPDQPSTPHDSPEQEPTQLSPHDSPLTGVNPLRSEEGSLQLAELMALYISLQRNVDALDKDKLAQAIEILSLKKRVEKLEKRRKSKPSVLRIGSATRVKSSEEAKVVVKPAETSVSAALDVEVSVAELAVTTVSSLVTTDSVTITAAEPVSVAAKEFTDNDMTIAEAFAELRTFKPKVVTIVPILNSATTVTTTKPKAKGITIQEPSVTQKTAVELEEEAKRQEEASMAVLAELHDVVQAQIDADRELAAIMTLEEHEKYKVEERARMLAEFIKNRKKQLAVERAEAIRSKPPIKSQDFEEIQGLYNKEKELVDTFVPIGFKEDERRIKDLNTKAEEESIDELWKNQEDWILKSWNFDENYGVRILMLEDSTGFHMLAERKYPLTKGTLKKMLVLRLTAESESEAAFDLLRFIQKQIDEM